MRGRSSIAIACAGLAGLVGVACNDHSTAMPTSPAANPTPAASACAYTPAPATMAIDAVGGMASVSVQSPAGCRWTATAESGVNSWVEVETGASVGPGTVSYAVQPNRAFNGRLATLVIRHDTGSVLATYSIAQRAAGCLYSLSPTRITLNSFGTYDGAGDSPVAVDVHAEPADCRWTATTSVPWIRIVYNTAAGMGDGRVYVSLVDWYMAPSARTGEVVVAGLSGVNPDGRLEVTQTGR